MLVGRKTWMSNGASFLAQNCDYFEAGAPRSSLSDVEQVVGDSLWIPGHWEYHCPNSAWIYSVLLILNHLMLCVTPESRWKHRVINLILDFERVDLCAMGFPTDWMQLEPWRVCNLHH